MSNEYATLLRDGLWSRNVVFSQLLAMCPAMAVTGSATNGLGMGLATTAVLVVSNALISSVRNFVSNDVRIPVFVVLIATLVTLVDMALIAWLHDLYKVLGLFIALIVVNCAIDQQCDRLGQLLALFGKNLHSYGDQDHANRICKWQANYRAETGDRDLPLITSD